jgi:hypothetical protein
LNNYPRPKNTKNQIKRIEEEEEEEEEESDYIARVPLWSRILRVCVFVDFGYKRRERVPAATTVRGPTSIFR